MPQRRKTWIPCSAAGIAGWLKEMNRIRVYGMKVRDGEQIIVREIVIDPITRRVRDTDTLTVDDMRDVTNIGTPGKRRQEGRVLR